MNWKRRGCGLLVVLAAGLLSPTAMAADGVIISEFMAANNGTLADEDGQFSDWIEIHNTSSQAVNLDGWFLTDTTNSLAKWRFPAVSLAANAYLIVFASTKDRTNSAAPLHTNFRLDAAGEYLALVKPDGVTVAYEFAPIFAEQFNDISYGNALSVSTTSVLAGGAVVKVFVPTDGALGTNWIVPAFDDATWLGGTTGVGFSSAPTNAGGLYAYWPVREGAGTTVSNLVSGGANGTVVNAAWVNNDPLRGAVLSFNGTSAYVAAGTIPRMGQTTSNFTWSFWYRQNAVNSVNATVLGNRSGGVQSPLQFIKITPTNFEYYRGANIGFIPYSIPTGQWLHLAVVKSGSALTYYSNGVRVGGSTAGGDIEANPFFFGGDPGAAGEWANGLIDDVALWTQALTTNQVQALAAGNSPLGVTGFGSFVGTDLKASMLNSNATAYLRIHFTVSESLSFNTLKLRMKYDDGFIAYLNGVEVARRNAPASAQWDSVATAARADVDAVTFEEIDLTPFIEAVAYGENVLAIQGLNVSASDGDFLILPELEASTVTDTGPRYFAAPTPGAVNNQGYVGFVADTKFSHDRGFYETNFSVTITCGTSGATIRYTTNGTPPGETNGLVYTGPIPITRTTVLRAAAFKPGYQPSAADAQTYIFLSDVFAQSGAGLPSNWGNDWRMDARVVTNAAYRADITNDMKSLPVVSLSLDPQQFWGPQGIYTLATSQGVNFERPCSAEMFFPDGSRKGFQIECGLRIAGGASRSGLTPKHGLRLLFKTIYGSSKLRYRFFDDTEVDRFDALTFRPNFNMSWVRTDNSGPLLNGNADGAERTHALYVRDQWTKESGNAMGMVNSHERFVHLYIDGVYWGLYNPGERTDASFAATYYGGEKEEYDAIFSDLSSVARPVDGDKNTWNAALAFANGGLSNATRYAEFARTYVNVTNLAEYMMLNFYCATVDWPWQNWNALRKRGTNQLFNIVVWDAEYTLDTLPWMPDDRTPNVGTGGGGVNGNDLDSPARFYYQCKQNAEWRLLFADRAHKHFFNNGSLTTNQTIPRFLRLCDAIDRGIVCESARWGDVVRTSNPYTRNVEWLAEKNRLLTVFFPRRTTNVIQHFRNAGLYPAVDAPAFNQHGIAFNEQFVLAMSAPVGTIYFTTNGSDPRLPGGAISPEAMVYTGDVTLIGSRLVRARALHTNVWSALNEAAFIEATPIPLRVTEIMYHPRELPGVFTNVVDDFEYIELKNVGSQALNLRNMRFTTGITFTFPDLVLPPGDYVLVVKNSTAFTNYYGGRFGGAVRWPTIAGEYTGELSDDGENLRLEGALGEVIQDFSYTDWYPPTDGLGFSLVIVNENAPVEMWEKKEGWRPGFSPSPDLVDPVPNIPRVLVNEVLTHTDPPQIDFIELHNPNAFDVDISGWFLTSDPFVPVRYIIPTNTTILAGGYRVFDETQFNPNPGVEPSFTLSSHGEAVYLFSGDSLTNLTGYSHGFSFGAASNGVSFGRHVISTGEEQFPAQIALTPGAANSGPRLGPIVLTEVMYHPPAGADEFVELQNISANAVPLYDGAFPSNTWKLAGLDFDFPANTVIPPGGLVVLVGTDPAAFQAKYNVPAQVQILGPFSGTLQDSGENLELQRPDTPDFIVPYLVMDAVRYNDRTPWPAAADGSGASLQRINPAAYGNDPGNWVGALPTPGTAYPGGPLPAITSQPSSQSVVLSGSVTFTATGGIGPLSYQWRLNGTDLSGATNAVLTFTNVQASQAGNYSVVVFNTAGSAESSNAVLTVLLPATITRQPQSQGVFPGNNAQFVVLANGALPLRYQWRYNGADVPEATNATYTVSNAQPGQSGDYAVVVSNVAGPLLSSIATLTVFSHPVFTLQPRGTNVAANVNVTFRAGATSSTPVRYQWYLDGNAISGATSSNLTLTGVQLTQSGNYTVTATDDYGSVTSQVATLTVLVVPQIRLEPQSQTVAVGADANMTAGAYGTMPLSFRWRKGSANLTNMMVNSTNSTYSLPNVRTNDAGTYNAAITNLAGPATRLTSNAYVTVVIPPINQSVQPGTNVTFQVTAVGAAPIRYQWQFNGTNVAGATNSSLSLSNVQPADAGTYAVVISVVTNVPVAPANFGAQLSFGGVDSDGDGIPDDWEVAHGLNPNDASDAALDSDGDGLTNVQEYRAGTDPGNAQSTLKLGAVVSGGGGSGGAVVLDFGTVPNRSYTIQCRDSFEGATGWINLTNIAASAGGGSVQFTNQLSGVRQRFYRIVTPALP